MRKRNGQKAAGPKKLFYTVGFLLFMALFFEAASFVSLMIVSRSLTPLSVSQAERKQVRESVSFNNAKEIFFPEWMQHDTLHPYIGFVLSPTPNDAFGFGNEISPIQTRDPKRYIVAITGGSGAYLLHLWGAKALREELLKIPELSNKEIVFIRLAAGGFKQPQQLMTLNYLISLGAEFDLVINLDGFNEAALPGPDNLRKKTFPIYPREWFSRIGAYSVPAIRYAMETGLLSRKMRGSFAEFFSRPFINKSAAFNAIWKAADRLFEVLIRKSNDLIFDYEVKSSDYEVAGPSLKFSGEADLYQYIAMNWARSSLLMSQICQANNTRYFHFLQPNQYYPGSKRLTEEEIKNSYKEDHPYRKGVLLGYPAMLSVARDMLSRINFYDLSMIFSEEDRTIYADDCCHYNSTGYEISAQEIGRIIQQNFSQSGAAHTPALRESEQEKTDERV